jgi:hypothetical protein
VFANDLIARVEGGDHGVVRKEAVEIEGLTGEAGQNARKKQTNMTTRLQAEKRTQKTETNG